MNNQFFPNRLMNDERQNPVVSRSESDFFPLSVAEHADGTFSIEWDEHDPATKIFNDWTSDDFIAMIRCQLDDSIAMHVSEAWDESEVTA